MFLVFIIIIVKRFFRSVLGKYVNSLLLLLNKIHWKIQQHVLHCTRSDVHLIYNNNNNTSENVLEIFIIWVARAASKTLLFMYILCIVCRLCVCMNEKKRPWTSQSQEFSHFQLATCIVTIKHFYNILQAWFVYFLLERNGEILWFYFKVKAIIERGCG